MTDNIKSLVDRLNDRAGYLEAAYAIISAASQRRCRAHCGTGSAYH